MEKNNDFTIDFIGVGDQKAASTWIFECLKEHPEICGSSKKETSFFRSKKYKQEGLDYYKKFFKHCSKDKLKGEFTAHYFNDEKAMERIYHHFPEVKLIISLRNPVERTYSHFKLRRNKKEIISTYEDSWKAIKKEDNLIEWGKYGKYLEKWLKLFPQENFKFIFYEDIKSCPIETMKELYSFLEVKKDFTPPSGKEKKNASGGMRMKFKIPFLTSFLHKVTVKIKNCNKHSNLPCIKQIKRSVGSGSNLAPFRFIFASFMYPFFHLNARTCIPHFENNVDMFIDKKY